MSVGKECALLFAVLFLPGMIAQGGTVDGESFNSIFYHLQILATAVPQTFLVTALAELRLTGSARSFGWRRPAWSDVVAAAGALAGLWAASALVALIAGALGGVAGEIEPTIVWSFDRLELIPVAVVSTLAIGYREEIFYRAYIATRADELQINPRLALAGGAIVFAAGHLYQGVAGFIVALAIGLLLGEVYLRTRSLHGIAVAHGLYNLAVLLVSASA